MKHRDPRHKPPSSKSGGFSTVSFWIVCILFCLIHSSNILRLDVYPFVDLPNHLAEATIFKYMDDPETAFSSYYQTEVDFVKPNTLHIFFCSLFGNIELGNTIYYLLYIFLVPLSILALIRCTGGNVWFSILSLLFLYNFSVMWGFTGFTIAIPLALITLVALLHHLHKPSLKHGIILASCLLLLYYAHVLVFLFALILSILAVFLHSEGSPARRLSTALPLLPAGIIFSLWALTGYEFQSEGSIVEFLKTYYLEEYFQSIPQRFSTFFWQDNSGIAAKETGYTIGLFVSLSVLCPFLAIVTPQNIASHCRKINRRVVLGFACMAAFLFLFLPDRLPGQGFLYQRYSVFVYLGIVCILSFLIEYKRRALLIVYICLVSLAHCFLWVNYFSSFKTASSCFDRNLLETNGSKDARLGAIIDKTGFRGQPVYVHYQNYNIIWNRRIAVTKSVDYRFGSIRRKVGPDRLPMYFEWSHRAEIDHLLNLYNDMDVMLTRGERPFKALSSSGRYALVTACEDWAVFRRKVKQ